MTLLFPAYRNFNRARISVNDSATAILIGVRLGKFSLENDNFNEEDFLPQLFEENDVQNIKKLNRNVKDAKHLLSQSEKHFSNMAIPYALAVHEAFMKEVITILQANHKIPVDTEIEDSLEKVHEFIAGYCMGDLDADKLSLFHITRRLRNRIVHGTGTAGTNLPRDYRKLGKSAKDRWLKLTGRDLDEIISSKKLDLSAGEVFAVFAVSYELVNNVMDLLAETLSREYWAAIAVKDYKDINPAQFNRKDIRFGSIRVYVNAHYSQLNLTDEELTEAIAITSNESSNN